VYLAVIWLHFLRGTATPQVKVGCVASTLVAIDRRILAVLESGMYKSASFLNI